MTRRFWFFSAALGTKPIPFRVLRAAAAFPTAGYGWFPLYLLLVALRKGRRHPAAGLHSHSNPHEPCGGTVRIGARRLDSAGHCPLHISFPNRRVA